ncbi:MAG: helicase-related protein [Candidatus Micrarchaeota archaeon]
MLLIPRAYQLAIYNSIMQNGNTLVILPTGLGKTLISLMLIKEKMKNGKCLLLTPTKPLAKQHFETTKRELETDNIALITGEKNVQTRIKEYKNSIIIATPQTIANDIKNNVLEPDFALCVFDESHRAVKNYAYTFVANALKKKSLIVGLTASPGGKRDKIQEVVKALNITNIEIRTIDDPDVKQYVQKSEMTWLTTELSPTLLLIKRQLDNLTSKHARMLGGMGFPPPLKNKGEFLKMRQKIMDIPNDIKYRAIVHYTILLNLLHMTELVETQGLFALREYIKKLNEKEGKSAKVLLSETEFNEVINLANTQSVEDHPKLRLLLNLMQRLKDKKIIIFAQYRDQIKLLEDQLNKNNFVSKQFVGKKDGVTRKIQEQTIDDFRSGVFNILVASSIGEEGLDIPSVDAVIFYEPVPSEIRSIQRRGRAARLKKGEIYILMTKGTRDEYYYWSAINKEKKMKSIVGTMRTSFEIDRKKKEIKSEQTEENKNANETAQLKKGQSSMADFF